MLLIAGPCVIENEKKTFDIAERLVALSKKLNLQLIFKASYKKANRSCIHSFKGIGDEVALKILSAVKQKYAIRVITDVHETCEVPMALKYVDIIQIPAFLCRQTELLVAAAKAPVVNIKKGQWMSPDAMKYAVEKVSSTNVNTQVWLTERGTSFGYNNLIVDMTSIPIMKKIATKVIVDCTHSVQRPNMGEVTGGNPDMIETIALAATASGADGLFFEVHPEPAKSPSDASSILHIDKLEPILQKVLKINKALHQ